MSLSRLFSYVILLATGIMIIMAASTTSAHAAQIVNVVAPTVATENPGWGKVIKRIPTTAPYGHDQLGLRVLTSVAGETNPVTGVQRVYYKVHLPYRRSRLDSSNGHVGWVASDNVTLVQSPWTVTVTRSKHTLTLYKNAKVYKTWKVVNGKSSTPTPAGQFAIYGKTNANHGFDGTGIMPFAYSPVHAQFDGGPGMLALHGRSGASLSQPTGTAASNGCIRMDNANMEILLANLPIGTPVTIK